MEASESVIYQIVCHDDYNVWPLALMQTFLRRRLPKSNHRKCEKYPTRKESYHKLNCTPR